MNRTLFTWVAFSVLGLCTTGYAAPGYFVPTQDRTVGFLVVHEATGTTLGTLDLVRIPSMEPDQPLLYCAGGRLPVTRLASFEKGQIRIDPSLKTHRAVARACGIHTVVPEKDIRIRVVDCRANVNPETGLFSSQASVAHLDIKVKILPVNSGGAPFPTSDGFFGIRGKTGDGQTFTCEVALADETLWIRGLSIPKGYNEWVCVDPGWIAEWFACDAMTHAGPPTPTTEEKDWE